MTITVIKHYDESKGNGYYLVSQDFDRVWYKGDTSQDAVAAFCKEHHFDFNSMTILEEV